jgi:AmiR/NasT family two-component response regulator
MRRVQSTQKLCLIQCDSLRAKVLRRHIEALGYAVREQALGEDSPADSETKVLVADLTEETRRPVAHLVALHRRFPQAAGIVLLRPEQALAADEAMSSGVCAVLREPLRLEELDLQLAICKPKQKRRCGAAGRKP